MTQRGATATPAGRNGFLRRMTFACAWGEGLDGFDLGVISVALPSITIALGLDPVLAGLIGASSLIGIFIGAPLAGWLTDRFGRKRVFTIDVLLFIVLGLLQAFASSGSGARHRASSSCCASRSSRS
ncbi:MULTISPECIES: MFS transporter [Curtobacterium]|uniref:MFS transporter n=1 Tax=Curtobacterium flaccumfaciens TaxID=2035 RepID=UPI003EE6962C